ncbi:MAG TPA: hypothetical protein VKG63_06750 [Steroidobacteraceae bacterium]|nr:hypothetical protein [Steroidobacteraceae bacterium]
MNIEQSSAARHMPGSRAYKPVFLLGMVGVVFLMVSSLFLGMAALFRDLRPRH